MDTTVVTRALNHPNYILTVKHEEDDNSFISHIIKLGQGHTGTGDAAEAGETIYSSYPKTTLEEAEKAAMDYYAQLRKSAES